MRGTAFLSFFASQIYSFFLLLYVQSILEIKCKNSISYNKNKFFLRLFSIFSKKINILKYFNINTFLNSVHQRYLSLIYYKSHI